MAPATRLLAAVAGDVSLREESQLSPDHLVLHRVPRANIAEHILKGRTGERHSGGIRSQTLPVADSKGHPIRKWLDRRNLWRAELPLPPSLRWIPADAPVFNRTHSGAGAITFPLAPIGAWREFRGVAVATAAPRRAALVSRASHVALSTRSRITAKEPDRSGSRTDAVSG